MKRIEQPKKSIIDKFDLKATLNNNKVINS